MAERFEGHGHEPIARLIAGNLYTTKTEPLKWAGEKGGGMWVPIREAIFHPFQWAGWLVYRITYYQRFPAVIEERWLRLGWNEVMRIPRTDGDGYHLVPRRPEGEKSYWGRFKHAWAVFRGKADVVYWMGQ
ncbi:hypothetical protein FDI21_gp305 [Pseudomonas phage Noxifer]|uniref:Uncharacterized protein n=1 Tax=Pseudomonas phage Noxifer TaxID=2006684 RepID=A0A1Y0T0E2_9CAUD|nr:hypothetical protein FDI21_gp305 [Pseudomonas phage Noxifer]ARV77406.1 hypothetical protein NOXIFER_241 [Pseudomonas phage Noxifer]